MTVNDGEIAPDDDCQPGDEDVLSSGTVEEVQVCNEWFLSIYLDGRNTSFLILAILAALPPAELVTRFQLFSYQLNDTISSIGIAEHFSFIQLWWCQLCGIILQIGLAKGRSCWDEQLYYSYFV